MTLEQFQTEFGAEFNKFQTTALYAALISVFEDASPSRTEMDQSPGNVIAGGTVFFAKTQGHEQLVRLFKEGLNSSPTVRVEREPEYRSET